MFFHGRQIFSFFFDFFLIFFLKSFVWKYQLFEKSAWWWYRFAACHAVSSVTISKQAIYFFFLLWLSMHVFLFTGNEIILLKLLRMPSINGNTLLFTHEKQCKSSNFGAVANYQHFFFKRTMFVWEEEGTKLVRLEEKLHFLDLPPGRASLSLSIDFHVRNCIGSDKCTASVDHRGVGLGIKVFIVSLSTPCAESTCNPAPPQALSVMRRTMAESTLTLAQEKAWEKIHSVEPGTSQP